MIGIGRLVTAMVAMVALAVSGMPTPTTAAAAVPPVPPRTRAAGLVDIRTVVPDAIVELRYATTDNFTHVRLYPVGARCLVHTSMAPGLRVAAQRLRRSGLVLVFWDCYRPHVVQVRMFRILPDPVFMARPGPYARSHEAGRSVDVTLARRMYPGCAPYRRVQGRCRLLMPTPFDSFQPRAAAFATTGVGPIARVNRYRLRAAMNAGGLRVYSGEWWHFDGPGAATPRPFLGAPLR